MQDNFDIVIIGSGLGGSAAASVLQSTGLSILIIERGDFVKQEKENWDLEEVLVKRRYQSKEKWIDKNGKEFFPRTFYNVGGSTKFYGGSALRFRESDFLSRKKDGIEIPSWPYGYNDLVTWYDKAESILGVHGQIGEDPAEAPRSEFPFLAIEHEERISRLANNLREQGLNPIHLPVAIDQGVKGRCIKGSPCDGFPCMYRAKGDAENCLLRPLLLKKHSNITLWTNAYVEALITDENENIVTALRLIREGQSYLIKAKIFILSAGAVNSAAILLRSKTSKHIRGLANSSGQLGRNFMSHNNTVILALSLFEKNPTKFQKTLAIHDFYELGTIQCRGKIKPENLISNKNWILRSFRKLISDRSIDFWLMSEDLPNPNNRVEVDEKGKIHLILQKTNYNAHLLLIEKAKSILKKAGLPIAFVDKRGISAIQHQCGTLRFGLDPSKSVLDQWGCSHDIKNLYAMDASFLPSSAVVNPALTILAQTLRAAEHLKDIIINNQLKIN